MKIRTTQSKVDEVLATRPGHSAKSTRSLFLVMASEGMLAVAICLLAAALRLILASRGWPYSNSDEATTGLMVYDIIWHSAHPFFTYGEHHVGSLDAYLQVPAFLLFGPTNFALHFTTTIQKLLFLLVFYFFMRTVFSTLVAGITLALLAFGPYQQLFYGLRAGHYAQDMLLLSALLLYLVLLRLRRPERVWIKWMLDLGIGLVAGLSLWSTPPPATIRSCGSAGARRRSLSPRACCAILVTPGPAHAERRHHRAAAVPHYRRHHQRCHLHRGAVRLWRNQRPAEALCVVLISVPFSLLAIGGWILAARPLIRHARTAFSRARHVEPMVYLPEDTYQRARQLGRAMLIIGLGLTVLQYVITRSSYESSSTSIGYISNVYLCIPLIVDPLCQGVLPLWYWLSSLVRHLARPARPHANALLALSLLLTLFAINITGAVNAMQESGDTQQIGVPAGQRDTQLISFLETHHATRFYTTWWVCYRLMFASQEHLDCYIVSNTDAFKPGYLNRVPAYAAVVTATPQPAYVFDLTTSEVARSVPQHLTMLIASRNPRFIGYTSAMISGYIVFFYAGSQACTCVHGR